ncbi:MAG: single-stranded DNA-binding protein [Bacteroidaceae bacterium]|nr:single-stranded DNA-binding protein [Bacteroidaceae bacterium]
METLNRVELVGMVGNVRHTPVGATSHAYNFSVATDYAYHGADGTPVIETTWHNCYYMSRDEDERIKRGATLRIHGRIQSQKYIRFDGKEVESYRILVNRILPIKKTIL